MILINALNRRTVRIWLNLRGRFHTLTITGLSIFLLSWLPNVPFWIKIVRTLWRPAYEFVGTTPGRIVLALCGIGLILVDQYRLNRKYKTYDLSTLSGQALKLRDEIQAFWESAPKLASPRGEGEDREDYLKRAYKASSRRVDHLVHGYEWRFADRTLRIHHQFGERGVRNSELDDALSRQFRNEDCYGMMVRGLTKLAQDVDL